MKKLFSLTTLIVAVIALITTGCEKTPEELLIGKWEVQSMDLKLYIDNVLEESATETYDPNEMVLEFLDGGSGKEYSSGTQVDTFNWTVNGDKLTLTYTGEDPVEVKFSVGENSLEVTMEESETDSETGDVYKMVMVIKADRV
jgi:hypothetical protein